MCLHAELFKVRLHAEFLKVRLHAELPKVRLHAEPLEVLVYPELRTSSCVRTRVFTKCVCTRSL